MPKTAKNDGCLTYCSVSLHNRSNRGSNRWFVCRLRRNCSEHSSWISIVLVVLGVVIGALMITSKKIEEEIYVVLLVTLVLLVASQFGVFNSFGTAEYTSWANALNGLVTNIVVFSGAAIIVLAVRTITHFHVSKITKWVAPFISLVFSGRQIS